jgi:putative Holliday junction resolvase
MAPLSVRDLDERLRPGERLLALDVGQSTIGLALSDVRRRLASPAETIRRTRLKADAEIIARLIERENVGGLVLGLPVEMAGAEGVRAEAVRHFADALDERLRALGRARPIAFWDERLSTAAALRVLVDEADLSRAKRRKAVDKMAAAYLLQGALDSLAARN